MNQRVMLTIDIEAHRSLDEWDRAHSGSVWKLFDRLRGRAPATCFLDVGSAATWGEGMLREIAQQARSDGHELGLHLHPHHYADQARWWLSQYSLDEQRVLLDRAANDFIRITGEPPRSFRAGGFGVDDNTIAALKQLGISTDLSFAFGQAGCHISPSSRMVRGHVAGLVEVPLPTVATITWGRTVRRRTTLDFNWLPADELVRAITHYGSDGGAVPVLLHSSSLSRRIGNRMHHQPALEERLERLLASFPQDSFITLARSLNSMEAPAEVPEYRIAGGFRQLRVLYLQALYGRGFSRRFAGLIWVTAGGIVVLTCLLVIALVVLFA
jgi:peptidoglycan/xylan/chitin deacetylase (PgdA/CDA1 family)